MASALQDLLERHVVSGTVPGAVASLGAAELEIVAAGAMSVGGAPMRADAIMRMKSMTKAVTAVAALRLVQAYQHAATTATTKRGWRAISPNRRPLGAETGEL